MTQKKKPEDKLKAGRKTKYRKEFEDQVFKYCLLGATDAQLAVFFEVAESTINKWKIDYPKFSESIGKGREKADAEIAKSLYHRAKGYKHDDIHISNYMGEVTQTPIVKHYPPDAKAITYWLNNRQKAKWRERLTTEHTGEDGGPIKTEFTLSPESIDVLQEIKANAGVGD